MLPVPRRAQGIVSVHNILFLLFCPNTYGDPMILQLCLCVCVFLTGRLQDHVRERHDLQQARYHLL